MFLFFFHSVRFNFINSKLEKSSCKKWWAGHTNTCIFRSTFRISLCNCTAVSFRLPSIQKPRGTSSCFLRETASKSRPWLLVRKPKQTLPHEPVVHTYVEQSRAFTCPLFYRYELHCFFWSKHYQRQNLNPQIQLSITYWQSLHSNLELPWKGVTLVLWNSINLQNFFMPKHQLRWKVQRNLPWYILLFTYRREKTNNQRDYHKKWKMLLIFPMEESNHLHTG